MYKLIVCDLDETLLNSDKKICQENEYAISNNGAIATEIIEKYIF